MAAVKLKSSGDSSCKHEDSAKRTFQSNIMSFSVLDACIVFLSMGTFVVDLTTDIILVINYFHHGHIYWAISTLLLIILPATVVQLFSMRWYTADESTDRYHWIAHIFLIGILHRYVLVLKTGLEARTSGDQTDFQRLYHQQSDICMLHLFESFMESAPQLVLQLYIMVTLKDWYSWTALSAAASLGSLAWAVAAYTRAMRRARPDKHCVSWPGLVLQATWRGGMLCARITALVIFALTFHIWILLFIGIHWLGMTIWVIFQKTDFCPTRWEERIYNCVVGIIYCFCFFNLHEGPSRHRTLAFYAIVISQNMACLGLFITMAGMERPGLVQISIVAIIGGTLLGISSMLAYYQLFHPAGPITLCSDTLKIDAERGMSPLDVDKYATVRSLKHHCSRDKDGHSPAKSESVNSQDGSPHSDIFTDSKSLLTNWMSSPSAVSNFSGEGEINPEMDGIEIEELDASKLSCSPGNERVVEALNLSDESIKQKRRGICSPQDLVLKLDEDNKEMRGERGNSDELCIEECSEVVIKSKRRAICSLESEVEIELKGCVEKDSSLDHENKLKRHVICSTADVRVELSQDVLLNMEKAIAENDAIVNSNTLPRIQSTDGPPLEDSKVNQSDMKKVDIQAALSEDSPSEILSAPSEVLSMHDYENMCAVNIARESWGLRSWRGYSDIETWLHDDSVVRDRRRDTLSTVTSVSSERSNTSSPPPLPCRRPAPVTRSRQDDYLDTLVDDLADCSTEPDFESDVNVFVARPYVADQTGAFFPLDTIAEETEESTDHSTSTDLGSACTLVATIDEIRHGCGSLSDLYSSQEHLWNASTQCLMDQTVYSSPHVGALLTTAHSRNHLTPEEVLFLSKLQASPDLELQNTFVHTPIVKLPQSRLTAGSNMFGASETNYCADVEGDRVNRKRTKPRRKVSLLREKFESTKPVSTESINPSFSSREEPSLTAVYTDSSIHGSTVNILSESELQENKPVVFASKRNVSPIVTHRIREWNSILKPQNTCNTSLNPELKTVFSVPSSNKFENDTVVLKPNFVNLKERRSMFLKQVLSPPKFHWAKKNSLSPKSKTVPAI